jgi:polyisoprenyl-teichoic acid--peptidoglycan teichoic acid transferase
VKRRVALCLAALTAWMLGAAVGTTPTAPARAAPTMMLKAAHGAQFLPALDGKKPIFILALGSDARPGQNVLRERSDSIHIIGVNPAKRSASILGFPRDSFVPIPGHGTNKITSAMSIGGPELTVKTVESLTGIHMDFFLLTSFQGLRNMVDSIGGLRVKVPFPMHDRFSGANFDPGIHHFGGDQALSFARDRHDVPGGDIGRSANQGRLFLAALAEFRKHFQKDPSVVLQWMGAGLRNVTTDLPLEEILKLAFTAQQVSPAKVKNVVVPGHSGSAGSESVVFINDSAAKAIFGNMKKDGLIN